MAAGLSLGAVSQWTVHAVSSRWLVDHFKDEKTETENPPTTPTPCTAPH